jgi:hypothetical protein
LYENPALVEQFCLPGIFYGFKQKILLGRSPMSSPWDPAITQAMQRHGGSNRSIPKTALSKMAQNKLAPTEHPDGAVAAPLPADEGPAPAGKPERP